MRKLLNYLDKLLFYFSGILFLGLFLINTVQIVIRSATSKSLLWVVDFSQLLLVWIVFLGATVALYRKEHLLIDYLKEKVSKKVSAYIDIITRILFLIFIIVISYNGIKVVEIRMSIDYVILGWPTGLAYLAIPVTGVIMILYLFHALYESIQILRYKKDSSQTDLDKNVQI